MPVHDPEFARWLVNSIRSGLVAIDERGAMAAWNAEAQRILGDPPGPPRPILGRDCREVLAAQPALARLLLDALGGRNPPSRAELMLERAGGDPSRTIGFTLTSLRDDQGGIRGAAVLFRDLTPFERSEEQDRLRDRLAALGEMAAGLAHELRNPLAGMEVMVGLLRRRLGDRPEERGLVEDLSRELRRAARAVSESLEFVRPASPRRRPCDAIKLLEESLRQARSRAGFDGPIERRYPPDAPTLVADTEGLLEVLTNLLVNAFEAMQGLEREGGHRLELGLRVDPRGAAPGRVRIGGHGISVSEPEASGSELVLWVTDTGPGIPEELRERIFYPFFTTKRSGSGVGLARAQKFVVSHGGQIEVDGRPGQGATLRLRLPLEAGTPS